MSRKLFYGGGCKNFPGTETIPFQWSDHIMLEDRSIDHREYLCMEDKDPKSEFAETVIENLGETGTIFTYIGYEAGVLKHLAD
jgi:hypothetical protein